MMASRRTRIKGIANIPQRRKTLNNTNPEDALKLLEKTSETSDQHNLKLEHEITTDFAKNQELSKNNTTEDCSEDLSPIIVENKQLIKITEKNHENNEKITNGGLSGNSAIIVENKKSEINGKLPSLPAPNGATSDSPKLSKEDPPSSTNDLLSKSNENFAQNSAGNELKPIVPIRRKFIKPTVSVNAIYRKPKDTENDSKSIVTPPTKKNKIIILNEVIANSNQTDIIIHNYVSDKIDNEGSEGANCIAKSLEVSNEKTCIDPLERDTKRLVPSSPQLLVPEIEYPIPPPSPNKLNRSRIKAVPRLGQRHTSFSASESEDETRRNYRHRNDSVCSSTSGLQDTNSISECLSPQKPTQKEFNSVIQRKCRRTEQSRKLAEARRDFYLKFGNKKPDRQKLTMIDLIFYNPVSNPMSNEGKNKRKISEVEPENEEAKVEEEVVDEPTNKTGSDEENEIPAPQIKIGPQGELVVDEQSLVIENKSVKKSREEIERSQLVNGNFETGYGIYRRAKRSKDWTKQETLKFYKALNTIGTDFTLMCELFPRRSRRELKMKFNKEERINRALVDKAIMQPCGFDFNDFKHEVDMEEKELQELENQKEREKILKQEAKKRKTSLSVEKKSVKIEKPKKKSLDILNVLDDDSDADESEIESVDDDLPLIKSIQKPTRSGRVPKILNRYKPPEAEDKLLKAKPGSLIVVGGTGSNGQPVYKVCMVTGDYGRQQVGGDMDSLEKALACKENGITRLFTLSASTTGMELKENNETIPAEENNVTIPADENNITIPANEDITISADKLCT